MTVTYTADIGTSQFGSLFRLLLRWRGSVYKLIYADYLVWLFGYFVVSLVYRLALNDPQRRNFEKLAIYCESWSDVIPLSFLLGFFVNIVYSRWWEMFMAIPWPTSLGLLTSAHVHGNDDRSRKMRRTLLRYCCLSIAMVFSSISGPVKKRFPKLDHFRQANLLGDENELQIMDSIQTQYPKYFIPLVWATSIVRRAHKEDRITDAVAKQSLIDKIDGIRHGCQMLLNYDWIPIPLEYTQVVTLAIYAYFFTCIFGRQFLDPTVKIPGHEIDMYFPIFTSLQFLFYFGWLKVAECLINPFGEDDDDFELNAIIDWNLKVSYLMVDEMHSEHPMLVKDAYWDQPSYDVQLPYTKGTESQFQPEPFMGSVATMAVSEAEAAIVLPPLIEQPEPVYLAATSPGGVNLSEQPSPSASLLSRQRSKKGVTFSHDETDDKSSFPQDDILLQLTRNDERPSPIGSSSHLPPILETGLSTDPTDLDNDDDEAEPLLGTDDVEKQQK